MIAIVQRVTSCDVHIDNKLVSSINHGILVLLGIEKDDNHDDIKYLSKKILKMRIFNDNQKNMNLSVQDVDGSIMIVSQFTLCANVKKGNRPSYIDAMPINEARNVYNSFLNYMNEKYSKIESGIFQADMEVKLVNDGPVTISIRSKN
mgnify:FL=1